MSTPSSDGRPSFSSEPSVSSSRTLASTTSATRVDNGEGRSSPQLSTSTSTSRHARPASQGSGSSPLGAEAIDEHDFAHRRPRAGRSGGAGGFLLDAGFPGPRYSARHDARHSTRHAQTADGKSKGMATADGKSKGMATADGKSKGMTTADGKSKGMATADGKSKGMTTADGKSKGMATADGKSTTTTDTEQHNGRLRVPKARGSMPAPAVDPNQLVHMALNLSESRRRNISASQLLGAPSRAPSAAHRDGSLSNAGVASSLRQYLNEQRRASRNMSPMGGRGSPSRHLSTTVHRSASMALPASHAISPSVATLLRRDRARAYIELRAEYMRLLHLLPPLKADANAPGNFIYSSSAVPGSPQAHLTRTPSHANKQHDLGRPYNPIQALRNRRSRARERLALPHEPAAFADIDQVHDWVDQVAEQSTRPAYRREDGVELPALHPDHDMQAQPAKPSKSQQGWSFTPEELLADAYWLEHRDNKTTIEDRNGRKIFAPREPPKPQKHDFLQPRPSKEYADKRRRSWVDGLPGTAADATGDESEHASERGRKRRLLPAIRADSRLRKGRGSPRKHSVGYSDSSDSDSDARRIRKSFDARRTRKSFDARRTRKSFDAEHNTGPLALQMKKKLELQTKGINAKGPAAFTPDTPDKWGRALDDVPDGKISRNSLEVPRFVNSSARIDENATLKMPPRSRTNPLSPIKSAEPRSSFEEDSTAPSTPLHARHFPHIGSDLSPPPSRAGSDHAKTKRSKLNIFHSSHDHDDKHEPESKQGSRQTSEEPQESSSLGTAILAAPGAVKNLLSHRKNDSVSSLPSPDKLRRREIHEPHSAVTRFFKGVKHEGTKVGDIIFRRDRADDTDASTISDRNSVDLDDDRRPALTRTVTSTTAGSATSDKDGRYHLKLPSFRPAHEALSDDDDASDPEHHISRQSRERRTTRSPRIDRLLPPRMDLERVSSASSMATLGPVRSRDQDHMNMQLARPGSVFPGVPPPTALKDAQGSHRSASRPTLNGKRHWSIVDGDEHQRKKRQDVATQADIARVRALFLCSGVKAKEIARRAQTPGAQAPHFLTLAAETAKEQLFPVPRKEEHVLAARILVHDLERSTSALHNACEQFRAGTIKDLNTRVIHLRDSIESDLMPRIFESGDKAVRITSEVSGQGPLQVKQINDEIDRMLRQRRRHTRWIMSWGWSAVEWTIVVALRFASILFALYGLLKGGVGMVWGVVRWLLWL